MKSTQLSTQVYSSAIVTSHCMVQGATPSHLPATYTVAKKSCLQLKIEEMVAYVQYKVMSASIHTPLLFARFTALQMYLESENIEMFACECLYNNH